MKFQPLKTSEASKISMNLFCHSLCFNRKSKMIQKDNSQNPSTSHESKASKTFLSTIYGGVISSNLNSISISSITWENKRSSYKLPSSCNNHSYIGIKGEGSFIVHYWYGSSALSWEIGNISTSKNGKIRLCFARTDRKSTSILRR